MRIRRGTAEYIPLSQRKLRELPDGVDLAKVDLAIEQGLSFDPEKRQDVDQLWKQVFVGSSVQGG